MRNAIIAEELISVIGEDGLIALANRYGGISLYVPLKVKQDKELVKTIGLEKAQALSARFAPDVIIVPLVREMRVLAFKAEGMTIEWIALRLGMSAGGVKKILKRQRDAGTAIGADMDGD